MGNSEVRLVPETRPVQEVRPIQQGSRHTKCPSCGSQNLQAVTETVMDGTVTQKGFSGTKACLGWFLLGPFGLLCGNCGSSQKTQIASTTKTNWICSDCGCKFPNLLDLRKELDAAKAEVDKGTPKNFAFLNIGMIVLLTFIFYIITEDIMSYIGWIIVIMILMDVLFAYGIYMAKKQYEKNKKEYDRLEKETTV